MFDMFSAWNKQAEKLKNGEIPKEEYDHWRYNYPKLEAERFKKELDELRNSRNNNTSDDE